MIESRTIHPSALPNDLPVEQLRRRPDHEGRVAIDPATAGWRYLSFRTEIVDSDSALVLTGEATESAVVLIDGPDLTTEIDGVAFGVLAGRRSVFEARPSAVYRPAGRALRIRAASPAPGTVTRVAIAEAPTRPDVSAGLEPLLVHPQDVRREIRGAGRSTREIRHILPPEFAADRLLLVEVLTPAGNWSSWPPHKHDTDDMPTEAVLEEVYHYRFRRPEAWAIQRLYRPAGGPLGPARDGVWAVRDGEVVLVTDGYHPFVTTDADDAWYLNALAGDRRTMACSFDPALDQVRERWASETPDPRVPFATNEPTD